MSWHLLAVGPLLVLGGPVRLVSQQPGAVLPRADASPNKYAGNCPARIEFIGHVTTDKPGTRIDYRWERSTGDSTKLLHARLGTPSPADTAHQNVTFEIPSDIWHVSLPSEGGEFWEVLHIESPFDIRSSPARVTVECR